jgi:TolB-like protein
MPGPPGPPPARRIIPLVLAFLVGSLFLWWLLEGFLPPTSPEPARVSGEAPPAGEADTLGLMFLPLEAVESDEAAGTTARMHGLITEGLREAGGLRVAAGEPSAPPGSGRRGGTGVEGVDAVLAGEVVEDGERLRLTLRLTAAPSGELLWTGSYEGRIGAADELARTAARSVADELALYAEVLHERGDP